MTDNERIERLNEIVENMKNTIRSSCDVHLFIDDFLATVDLINRQKAEIDCLRKELEKLHSHKDFLRAEIERLKDYNENLLTANTALSNEILDIKTEAIKEFAERFDVAIDEKIGDAIKALNPHLYLAKMVAKDIVKEMTE